MIFEAETHTLWENGWITLILPTLPYVVVAEKNGSTWKQAFTPIFECCGDDRWQHLSPLTLFRAEFELGSNPPYPWLGYRFLWDTESQPVPQPQSHPWPYPQGLPYLWQSLTSCQALGHHLVFRLDNASNNNTMLEEFAHCYQFKTDNRFDIKRRHIQ